MNHVRPLVSFFAQFDFFVFLFKLKLMRLAVVDADKCVGCQSCMFACVRFQNEGGLAKTRISVKSSGGMSQGFMVIVCRGCEVPSCAKVCPTDALTPKKGGGVILDPTKCTGCGHCVSACPLVAVFWDDETNKPHICTSCGYCVKYCPHQVL